MSHVPENVLLVPPTWKHLLAQQHLAAWGCAALLAALHSSPIASVKPFAWVHSADSMHSGAAVGWPFRSYCKNWEESINTILRWVTKTHSQPWLRTEGECPCARAENTVGRERYQLSANIPNPVQTDRKTNAVTKLTQRTCRMTAPCLLSSFVKMSLGNSWRAAKGKKKKKPRCFIKYSKLPQVLLRNIMKKTLESFCGAKAQQSHNNHTYGPLCTGSLFCLGVSLA